MHPDSMHPDGGRALGARILHLRTRSLRCARIEMTQDLRDGVYDSLEHRVSFVNMNQLLVTQSIVCPQETDHVFDKLAVWGPHEPVWAHLGPHGPMCTHMDPLWAHMGPSGPI